MGKLNKYPSLIGETATSLFPRKIMFHKTEIIPCKTAYPVMQSPEKKDVSHLCCRVQIGNQQVSIASLVRRPLLDSSEGGGRKAHK